MGSKTLKNISEAYVIVFVAYVIVFVISGVYVLFVGSTPTGLSFCTTRSFDKIDNNNNNNKHVIRHFIYVRYILCMLITS